MAWAKRKMLALMAARKRNSSPVPVPPRVRSLIGMRFGRLEVKHFAGMDKHSHSYWCCLCDCGSMCRVPGSRLLGTGCKEAGHYQKSCGCMRADSGIRKAARAKVPRERRGAICNRARAAVRERKPAYSMDAYRAAELLGVSVERVEVLAKDGLIGSTYKRGELWVSSGDVASLIGVQERNKRHCRTIEEWEESVFNRGRADGGGVSRAHRA